MFQDHVSQCVALDAELYSTWRHFVLKSLNSPETSWRAGRTSPGSLSATSILVSRSHHQHLCCAFPLSGPVKLQIHSAYGHSFGMVVGGVEWVTWSHHTAAWSRAYWYFMLISKGTVLMSRLLCQRYHNNLWYFRRNERSGGIFSHSHLRYPQPECDICALRPKLSSVYSVVNPFPGGWCVPGVDVLHVGSAGASEPKGFLYLSSFWDCLLLWETEKSMCVQSLFCSTACKHLLEWKRWRKGISQWRRGKVGCCLTNWEMFPFFPFLAYIKYSNTASKS